MEINITKEQYKELITAVAIANGIVGVLGDAIEEPDYKKHSEKLRDLEDYLLQFADDFGYREFVQEDEQKEGVVLDDEFYENKILPIITEYEEFSVLDTLSNELAWRDFRKDHSGEEIKKMAEKNGGYFGVALYDYEKKYWDEFEKYAYERLEIQK